jgi:hypothetical protein
VARLQSEAETLAARGDYSAALAKYEDALALEPENVGLRFALGSVLSHLNRLNEAVTQFRWVVSRAARESPEHQGARRWLLRVGALVEPETRAEIAAAAPTPEAARAAGRVIGRTEWPGVDPRDRFIRGRIAIAGDEPATHGVRRDRPFRLGDRWEFRDLPPGKYRLVARVGETILWDQGVTVGPGRTAEVSLTAAGSPVSPDQFPGDREE